MRPLIILSIVALVSIAALAAAPSSAEHLKTVERLAFLLEFKAENSRLTANEKTDLALAYFNVGRFQDAVLIARIALGEAEERRQKALLYLVKAQSEAALGHFRDASDSATKGQRLSPESSALALLRVVYAEASGNQAGALAAMDHLKRLDPNIPEPVMSMKEMIVMGGKVAYWGWVIWQRYGDDIRDAAGKAQEIGRALLVAWQDISAGKQQGAIP